MPRQVTRPGSRGVYDGPRGDVAVRRAHRGDTPRPIQLETRALHAVLEPYAEPLCALDVAAQHLHRPEKAVRRSEHATDEPLGADRGVDVPYLLRPHLPRVLEPGGPLDASRPSQRVELRLVAREEEVPAPAVAGVHTELLLEAHELLARE